MPADVRRNFTEAPMLAVWDGDRHSNQNSSPAVRIRSAPSPLLAWNGLVPRIANQLRVGDAAPRIRVHGAVERRVRSRRLGEAELAAWAELRRRGDFAASSRVLAVDRPLPAVAALDVPGEEH